MSVNYNIIKKAFFNLVTDKSEDVYRLFIDAKKEIENGDDDLTYAECILLKDVLNSIDANLSYEKDDKYDSDYLVMFVYKNYYEHEKYYYIFNKISGKFQEVLNDDYEELSYFSDEIENYNNRLICVSIDDFIKNIERVNKAFRKINENNSDNDNDNDIKSKAIRFFLPLIKDTYDFKEKGDYEGDYEYNIILMNREQILSKIEIHTSRLDEIPKYLLEILVSDGYGNIYEWFPYDEDTQTFRKATEDEHIFLTDLNDSYLIYHDPVIFMLDHNNIRNIKKKTNRVVKRINESGENFKEARNEFLKFIINKFHSKDRNFINKKFELYKIEGLYTVFVYNEDGYIENRGYSYWRDGWREVDTSLFYIGKNKMEKILTFDKDFYNKLNDKKNKALKKINGINESNDDLSMKKKYLSWLNDKEGDFISICKSIYNTYGRDLPKSGAGYDQVWVRSWLLYIDNIYDFFPSSLNPSNYIVKIYWYDNGSSDILYYYYDYDYNEFKLLRRHSQRMSLLRYDSFHILQDCFKIVAKFDYDNYLHLKDITLKAVKRINESENTQDIPTNIKQKAILAVLNLKEFNDYYNNYDEDDEESLYGVYIISKKKIEKDNYFPAIYLPKISDYVTVLVKGDVFCDYHFFNYDKKYDRFIEIPYGSDLYDSYIDFDSGYVVFTGNYSVRYLHDDFVKMKKDTRKAMKKINENVSDNIKLNFIKCLYDNIKKGRKNIKDVIKYKNHYPEFNLVECKTKDDIIYFLKLNYQKEHPLGIGVSESFYTFNGNNFGYISLDEYKSYDIIDENIILTVTIDDYINHQEKMKRVMKKINERVFNYQMFLKSHQ